MREIKLEELKKIQIEILDEVHHFCEENRITYFLSSGTLLGAVRHKGYIPWDDDIDIYIPRRDYERFLKIYKGSTTRIRSLYVDSKFPFAFAKVEKNGTVLIENADCNTEIGVNIDVFPLDGVPNNLQERRALFNHINSIRHCMTLKSVSIDFKKRSFLKNTVLFIGKIILAPFSLHYLASMVDKAIDKNNDCSQYVCNIVLGNGFNTCFSRDAIKDTIEVLFEGQYYKTMAGYDEYLHKTYGDYMQLPPVEKRVSHHSFSAYWLDTAN